MNYLKTFLPYLFGNKKGKSLEIPLPSPVPWASLNFEEVLMFHALANTLNQYLYSLNLLTLSKKDIHHLFNFIDLMNADLRQFIYENFTVDWLQYSVAINARAITKREIQELLDFKNNQLSVFVILKKNRKQTGRLVIRKADGQFMTDVNGVWSIPVLGLSSRGLAFNHSNGCTPCGVYTIDSVMPENNKKFEFGEYRRLILNFIPKSEREADLTKYLPLNHHHKTWWKPSIVARELGRSLLRIHGTGRTNYNPFSPYFPFVPTSGCLATNEVKIKNFKLARDQRFLLDQLMAAQGLPKLYENESKIHGLLYVVELDDNLSALHFKT